MSGLWIPGAAEPSLEDFVRRVHRQIERYTTTHAAERSEVEVEFADGQRLTLQSLSAEPGYGFLTLTTHADAAPVRDLIVPIGSIRRISLGPAEGDRGRFGFALPDDAANEGGPDSAA